MSSQCYFCWVRVIPAALEGGTYDVDGKNLVYILDGSKRPKRTGTSAIKMGRRSVIWFDCDAVHYGNPRSDVVFDFGPAFVDNDDAVGWLRGLGQAWAKEAVNFFLLKVEDESDEQGAQNEAA